MLSVAPTFFFFFLKIDNKGQGCDKSLLSRFQIVSSYSRGFQYYRKDKLPHFQFMLLQGVGAT